MRKLKIFGIFCLLSYCTAFIAFAASTINQPSSDVAPHMASDIISTALAAPGTENSPFAELNAQPASKTNPAMLSGQVKTTGTLSSKTKKSPATNQDKQEKQNAAATQQIMNPAVSGLGIPLPSAAPLAITTPSTPSLANKEHNPQAPSQGTSLGLPLPCATAVTQNAPAHKTNRDISALPLSGEFKPADANFPQTLPGLPNLSKMRDKSKAVQGQGNSPQKEAHEPSRASSTDHPVQFSLPLPRLTPDKDVAFKDETFIPTTSYRVESDAFHEAAQRLQGLTITPGFSRNPQSEEYSFTTSNLSASSGKTTMNTLSSPDAPDKKKTFQLANGLRVILQKDDRFPLVSLRLYVHAGSAYESPKEAGISHVLEHMVFKGSKNYGDGEIAREIEKNGGYLNAFTSFDQTGYIVDLPSATWEKGLLVLKEMAFLPNFTPEHLASEKEVIVAELKRGQDSPGNVLFTQIIDGMFAGSPYAHPIIGYEETIRSFTVQDLYAYHERWYQPQAMTLVICGNIDLDSADKLVAHHFGVATNNQDIIPPRRKTTPHNEPLVNIQEGPWQKARLTLTFPAPNLRDNKAIYLDLLTHIIGGDQTSPLFKKYKYDKRLVDSIAMQSYNFEESGLVFVMATLDPENIKPFWEELLNDMHQGFPFEREDLARAQLALQDSFYRSRETLEGYASQIGHFNFYFSGETDANNYLTTIANADIDTLHNLYMEIFKPQQAGIFGIIPGSKAPGGRPASGQTENLERWLAAELSRQWPATLSSGNAVTAENDAPRQEVITLDNGCTLVLLPDATLPYTSATLLFDGGESLLSPATQGLGALTADVLTRGTKSKDYNAIQTFLAERAASLKASSNRLTFGLSFSSPSQYTQDLFALVREIITTPSFSVAETDRVKENIQSAIICSEEQPISLAFRHLTAFLYPQHSYGYLQLGTTESITSFTHADAQAHWEKQRSYPWTLAICGDFSKKDILALARQLPSPTKTRQPLPAPVLTKDKALSLSLADREQAHLFLVFPIPGINAPDEAGLELLTTILAGQSGLLFSELRDKQGLGYTVTAFPWKTKNAGALIFYIGTDPESLEKAYAGFAGIIASLSSTPLDKSALDRGKNILSGEYYRERQSLSSRSAEGATLVALGLPLDFKRALIDRSQELTPENIRHIAQKYLDLEKSFIVKVLPQATKLASGA